MSAVNCNPETGVRYGVIACQSLDQDLVHELWYGSQARNLSEEFALEDLRAEMVSKADAIEEDAIEDALAQARESGITEPQGVAILVETAISIAYSAQGADGREDFIEDQVSRNSEHIEIECPVIQGSYEGVTYQIGWLGGAPLLTVVDGPLGFASSLCSPLRAGRCESRQRLRAYGHPSGADRRGPRRLPLLLCAQGLAGRRVSANEFAFVFEGHGSKTVFPLDEWGMPGNPVPVRRSTARGMAKRFEERGHSVHSPLASTLWVIVAWGQYSNQGLVLKGNSTDGWVASKVN